MTQLFPDRRFAAFLFDMDGTIPTLDHPGRAGLARLGALPRP